MEPARLRPDGLFYAVGCARDLTGCRLQDDVVGEQRADNLDLGIRNPAPRRRWCRPEDDRSASRRREWISRRRQGRRDTS